MATSNIALIDGDGFETGKATVEYTGKGDGEATVTAEECEGLDRGGVLTFSADGCADVERKVFQLGLREKFTDDDFFVADGGTFHVLKDSSKVNYYKFVGSDDADSVVTIDGVDTVIPAGATVEGMCSTIENIEPDQNYLKSVKLIGDIAPRIGRPGDNYRYLDTIESVELYGRGETTLSLGYFCCGIKGASTRIIVKNIKTSSLIRAFSDIGTVSVYPEVIDVSTIDTSGCTNLNTTFYNSLFKEIRGTETWTAPNNSQLHAMVSACYNLKSIDLSSLQTSKVTQARVFSNSNALERIVFGDGWDLISAVGTDGTNGIVTLFNNCTSLTTIEGSIRNIMEDLDASACPLTRDSALVLLNGLYDYASEGQEGKTATFSSTTKALLTDDDIKIATDKGWSIA